MTEEPYVWIVILVSAGATLLFWRNKRKFERNKYGAEQFSSYTGKLAAETGDSLLFLIGYVALVMGLFMLIIYDHSLLGWLALATLLALSIYHVRRKEK